MVKLGDVWLFMVGGAGESANFVDVTFNASVSKGSPGTDKASGARVNCNDIFWYYCFCRGEPF
jgi:hypothetical protein